MFFDISNQPLFNDSYETPKVQNIPNAMALRKFPGSLTSAYAPGGARKRILTTCFCDMSNQPLFIDSFEEPKVQNIPNAIVRLEFPGSLTSAYASGGVRRRIPIGVSNQPLFNDSFEKSEVLNIPNTMALLEFPGSLTSAYASGGVRTRIPFGLSNQPLLNDSFEKSKVWNILNTMALLEIPGSLTSAYVSGGACRRFDISNQPLFNDSFGKSKVQSNLNTDVCSTIVLSHEPSMID